MQDTIGYDPTKEEARRVIADVQRRASESLERDGLAPDDRRRDDHERAALAGIAQSEIQHLLQRASRAERRASEASARADRLEEAAVRLLEALEAGRCGSCPEDEGVTEALSGLRALIEP